MKEKGGLALLRNTPFGVMNSGRSEGFIPHVCSMEHNVPGSLGSGKAKGWGMGNTQAAGGGLVGGIDWNTVVTLTFFHSLIDNVGLFLAFGFGDHHGCEGGDKVIVE